MIQSRFLQHFVLSICVMILHLSAFFSNGLLAGDSGRSTSFTVPQAEEFGSLRQFADVVGDENVRILLERCYDVLAGTRESNHFRQIIAKDTDGQEFFVNDNAWWRYTCPQCNCQGTYGWRPFFDEHLRQVDLNTIRHIFKRQSTGKAYPKMGGPRIVPRGALPCGVNPAGAAGAAGGWDVTFYYNYFPDTPATWHPDHDEAVDFQLLGVITAADWILWQRDEKMARWFLPKLEALLDYIDSRTKRGELLLIGVQGSQIEFGHGTIRYPLSTQWYWLKTLQLCAEVFRFVGEDNRAAMLEARLDPLRAQIQKFRMPGGWYMGGRGEDFTKPLGTGTLAKGESSYFETWPNTAPALFFLLDQGTCFSIAQRILSIPEMTANHIGVYNFPARPVAEMDDGGAFPPPGAHVNGGWFWMTAGTTAALLARAQHPRACALTAELLVDHDERLTIDYYNDYGANKEKQWLDKRRPDQCSISNMGAFGDFLRAIIGVEALHDGLAIRPALPLGVEQLTLKAPIRFGNSLLYLHFRRSEEESEKVNGKLGDKSLPAIPGGVFVPATLLGPEAYVTVTFPR